MYLSLNSTLGTVFTIFAAFWVVVFVVLFIGVGLLLKRRHRLEAQRHSGHD
jgi:uncharacterized membrane protein